MPHFLFRQVYNSYPKLANRNYELATKPSFTENIRLSKTRLMKGQKVQLGTEAPTLSFSNLQLHEAKSKFYSLSDSRFLSIVTPFFTVTEVGHIVDVRSIRRFVGRQDTCCQSYLSSEDQKNSLLLHS